MQSSWQDATAGETDQYFFKMYFWEHPELLGPFWFESDPCPVGPLFLWLLLLAPVRSVTLDYYQSIFGNFVEVEGTACHDGLAPAVQHAAMLHSSFDSQCGWSLVFFMSCRLA